MIIFFSGSGYSKVHPNPESEQRMKRRDTMMTWWEISNKLGQQDKRFRRLVKQRKGAA